MLKVLRVGTCKCPLNIMNFQARLVLAAMQKNWSLVLQTLCFLCNVVVCTIIAKV